MCVCGFSVVTHTHTHTRTRLHRLCVCPQGFLMLWVCVCVSDEICIPFSLFFFLTYWEYLSIYACSQMHNGPRLLFWTHEISLFPLFPHWLIPSDFMYTLMIFLVDYCIPSSSTPIAQWSKFKQSDTSRLLKSLFPSLTH